ncbi:unnamed protein product [Diplocarpon coronariae]
MLGSGSPDETKPARAPLPRSGVASRRAPRGCPGRRHPHGSRGGGGNAPGLTDRPDRCPFPPPAGRAGSPDGPAVPGRVRRADETVDGGEMRVAGMGVVLRGDRRAKALVLRRPRRPGWCVPYGGIPAPLPRGQSRGRGRLVPGRGGHRAVPEGEESSGPLPGGLESGCFPPSPGPGPGHLSGSFSRPVEPEPEPEPAPKSRRRLFGKDTPNLCETVSAPASPRHTGLCPPPSRLRPASYPPLIRL